MAHIIFPSTALPCALPRPSSIGSGRYYLWTSARGGVHVAGTLIPCLSSRNRIHLQLVMSKSLSEEYGSNDLSFYSMVKQTSLILLHFATFPMHACGAYLGHWLAPARSPFLPCLAWTGARSWRLSS